MMALICVVASLAYEPPLHCLLAITSAYAMSSSASVAAPEPEQLPLPLLATHQFISPLPSLCDDSNDHSASNVVWSFMNTLNNMP